MSVAETSPRRVSRRLALLAPAAGLAAIALADPAAAGGGKTAEAAKVHYRRQVVGEVDVFYREAGPKDAPVILLLHGFPTSGHMFRDLIPHLAGRYRVIAPDLPGFGQTKAPPRGQFDYTFDNLAKVVDGFTQALGLSRYAIYVFDYGAPTGFRLAAAHPERVTAIITQNGNAYEEGLSSVWAPLRTYWADPSPAHRAAVRALLTPEMTRRHYLDGADPDLVSPDSYELDIAYLARPGQDEIQLDLFYDYRTNVASYPTWQAYFRQHKPPILAAWGDKDIFFLPPGAKAFKRDQPEAEVRFLDTGHFALETHSAEIGALIVDFLERTASKAR
ncbi:putative hydrolase or acyltransferase of alpha/beta superfamily [Caulobacter sp. AP07]|uniref:alpha/beta fold hydrolase n=1 Tax=Caulobacter sp. AP07 TaxID=1144304 RepID=UPI000271FC4B|nr:alpha/beta fold hydrolase [Caulobacter sp. AP07]EJL33895.1 putative hydrolase or acyltransferase of alpha/beta superfamily [Caulobacter sp. AP07]